MLLKNKNIRKSLYAELNLINIKVRCTKIRGEYYSPLKCLKHVCLNHVCFSRVGFAFIIFPGNF
jgi:hypothetical protein